MKKRKKEIRSVGWWEPRWSFVPRTRWELKSLLSPRMWLRVLVLVTVVAMVLAAVVRANVPNLQFNWAGALLACVGLLGVQLAFISAVYLLVPPRIGVNRRRVVVQHGNSTRGYAMAKIEGVDLTLHSGGKHRLWITLSGRSRCYGMPAAVDIAALKAILGDKLTVHDYRDDDVEPDETLFRIAS